MKPIFNSYEELKAAQADSDKQVTEMHAAKTGQVSSDMAVWNQPHLNFGDKGGLVDFRVEWYDQNETTADNPNGIAVPAIVTTAEKQQLKAVSTGSTPFYGKVTTGHAKLPSGNVAMYDGNKEGVVTMGNWNDNELQALRANGYKVLPAGWESKAYFK